MQRDPIAYDAALAMPDLIAAIRGLVDDERRGQRLLCRYLADLADRVAERGFDLMGGFSDVWSGRRFADVYHASRCLFGMGVRRTRELVRVGRALRVLPRIEQAFVEGRLSYSKVRELTRVARADDEDQWLLLARTLPMRVLERRVAEAA